MTRVADRLLTHLHDPSSADLDPDALARALLDDDSGDVVCALVAHRREWAEAMASRLREFPAPRAGAAPRWIAAACTVEDSDIDDRIDSWIADDDRAPAALDGLLRAGCDWTHPALPNHLRRPETRFSAAWMLARNAPEQLEEAIDALEDPSDVVALLRVAALAGAGDWFEPLVEWRDQLVDAVSDRDATRLDGAIATVAPDRYARLALGAELDTDWMGDDRAVADFITRHGASAWVPTLALFRHVGDRDAFALTAAFATSAAFVAPLDEADDEQLAPHRADQWIAEHPRKIAFQLAIAENEQWAQLLVETALHQTLRRRGIGAPAITGLPLSGPPPDDAELDELLAPLLEDVDFNHVGERVAMVRTLTDLHTLMRRDAISAKAAGPIFERCAELGTAPRKLLDVVQRHRPPGDVGDWGCRGLHAVLWHLHRPRKKALPPLARAWFDAPPERASLIRTTIASRLDSPPQ